MGDFLFDVLPQLPRWARGWMLYPRIVLAALAFMVISALPHIYRDAEVPTQFPTSQFVTADGKVNVQGMSGVMDVQLSAVKKVLLRDMAPILSWFVPLAILLAPGPRRSRREHRYS